MSSSKELSIAKLFSLIISVLSIKRISWKYNFKESCLQYKKKSFLIEIQKLLENTYPKYDNCNKHKWRIHLFSFSSTVNSSLSQLLCCKRNLLGHLQTSLLFIKIILSELLRLPTKVWNYLLHISYFGKFYLLKILVLSFYFAREFNHGQLLHSLCISKVRLCWLF